MVAQSKNTILEGPLSPPHNSLHVVFTSLYELRDTVLASVFLDMNFMVLAQKSCAFPFYIQIDTNGLCACIVGI